MTPLDLLDRAKAEGVVVELKVRLKWNVEPSPELLNLLRTHRDDLLTYLALEQGGTPQMCRLSEQLKDGAVWCHRCYHYQTHPCRPSHKFYKESDKTPLKRLYKDDRRSPAQAKIEW
jgi:hypothetical protein